MSDIEPYKVTTVNYDQLQAMVADIYLLLLGILTPESATAVQEIARKLSDLREESHNNVQWRS